MLFSKVFKEKERRNKPHEKDAKVSWVLAGIILKTLSISSKGHTALIVDPNESFHETEFDCGRSKMLV